MSFFAGFHSCDMKKTAILFKKEWHRKYWEHHCWWLTVCVSGHYCGEQDTFWKVEIWTCISTWTDMAKKEHNYRNQTWSEENECLYTSLCKKFLVKGIKATLIFQTASYHWKSFVDLAVLYEWGWLESLLNSDPRAL